MIFIFLFLSFCIFQILPNEHVLLLQSEKKLVSIKLKIETTAQANVWKIFCLVFTGIATDFNKKKYGCNLKNNNNNTFMFYIRKVPNNVALGEL